MKTIYVTAPSLPDRAKYEAYVDRIFNSGWLTNNGQLVNELEKRLEGYLGVKNIVLVANGTLALQIAYKLLELDGEVITTPFTFIATSSSLVWEGLNIVYSEINQQSFNLDPARIEGNISKNTSAIMPVHVFGNPCNVEAIQDIADKHGLKLIYDASHSFGVTYKGRSVLEWGDISTLSFHATKLFHTAEGGALIIKDNALALKARRMINFGFNPLGGVDCLGINAKMNEFQAAMGLALLEEHDKNVQIREQLSKFYDERLTDTLHRPIWNSHASRNYGYYPALFPSEEAALRIVRALETENIFPRRYFYPSLETLDYFHTGQNMPVSRDIAERILCLPIHTGVNIDDIDNIARIIEKTL